MRTPRRHAGAGAAAASKQPRAVCFLAALIFAACSVQRSAFRLVALSSVDRGREQHEAYDEQQRTPPPPPKANRRRRRPSAPETPEACRPPPEDGDGGSSAPRRRRRRRRGLPKSSPPPAIRTVASGVDGVPPEYLRTVALDAAATTPTPPMSLLTYDDRRRKVVTESDRSASPLTPLPSNVTFVCIPDGIVVDSSVAGPYRDDGGGGGDGKSGDDAMIYLHQGKRWFPLPDQVSSFVSRSPSVTDWEGMGVQVSSWTGFTWNHFSLDTLPRLGLVYDALTGGDPLWSDARLIVASSARYPTPAEEGLRPMVRFVYDRLNLTHRLISNNGWVVEAEHTHRFEYMVFPDVTPQPICGPNRRVKDATFPRGVMEPIQTALGSLSSNEKKYVVYAIRKGGRRVVDPERSAELVAAVRKLLSEIGSDLEVLEWSYDEPSNVLDVFRHASIVMGPHGANLWNAAFAPPGGLLLEFASWNDTFVDEDCRTVGYSLANAAGLSYGLVESEHFSYDGGGKKLRPDVDAAVEMIRHFLVG